MRIVFYIIEKNFEVNFITMESADRASRAGTRRRRIEPAVREDLGEKMVLVSGPRQCGKTTLAERLLAELGGAYFSWDVQAHRSALRAQRLPENEPLWVFDGGTG
jgi:predicted AAA+ superfamily ATPase